MDKRKYKLIIIDDEYFVVRGLRETIDWDALNIEVVADCSNGQQGLDAVHKFAPDLVISDIKMPIMDGISLAEALHKENFDGGIIFYSGYGDFEYARKALELNIVRYMLKPIDNDSLIKIIKEALDDINKEREKRKALGAYAIGLPLMKGALLMQYLNGDTESVKKLAAIGVTIPSHGVAIYSELCYTEETSKTDTPFEAFYNSLMDALSGFNTVGHKYDDSFIIVTEMDDIILLSARVEKSFEILGTTNRVFVGISNKFGEGTSVTDAFAKAKALRKEVLFPSVNCVLSVSGDTVSPRKKIVYDAMDIIAKNYDKKITADDVAAELYISVSYLMHELKEALGKTFIDCLTEYRMLKAKEMLMDGRLRINEIAANVGYSDVRYFGQVFKKTTGKTPSEFAESKK